MTTHPTAAEYRLTYDVSAEAWYAHTDRDGPRIDVHRSHVGGGVAWEFHVEERNLNGPTLRVQMFDDSWDAFADVPELFEALRTERPHTLTELRALLDRLGFADITKRVQPRAEEAGDAAELNAVVAVLQRLRGFVPLDVRYGAAAAALAYLDDHAPANTTEAISTELRGGAQ
jgi:hypothetical protein